MNEHIIREIKAVYSGKLRNGAMPVKPAEEQNEIFDICEGKPFFNEVIDKLKIAVSENKS